jgi:hypothetical protein
LGYKPFSLAWHFKVWIVAQGMATHEEVFYTKPKNIRNLLQQEGTERGRLVYGNDIWCYAVREWINVLHENMGISRFYVPDCRFPNEVEFIKSMGGTVYRIHAPLRNAATNLSEEARQHISETALDEYNRFDGIIYNDPEFSHTITDQINKLLGRSENTPNIFI